MPEAWLEDFIPFSLLHAASVAVCSALMLGSCWLGRCFVRGSARERRLRRVWGGIVLGFWLGRLAWYFVPSRFDITHSLPLHICDLAGFVGALTMLTGWRPARTLLYFWGIGLSTQAFVTPTLDFGVGYVEFYLFWTLHLMVVGSAVYDLVVGGYRPGVRDLGLAVVTTLAYLAAALPFNLWLGTNYGFVGAGTPDNPTLLDAFGPWPWRVGVIVFLGLVEFLFLWEVWYVADLGRLPVRRGWWLRRLLASYALACFALVAASVWGSYRAPALTVMANSPSAVFGEEWRDTTVLRFVGVPKPVRDAGLGDSQGWVYENMGSRLVTFFSDRSPTRTRVIFETGWPLRAFSCTGEWPRTRVDQVTWSDCAVVNWPKTFRIPLTPHPIALLVDLLMYAAITLVVAIAWRLGKSVLRRERGQCLTCGYEMTGNGTCPECGVRHAPPL